MEKREKKVEIVRIIHLREGYFMEKREKRMSYGYVPMPEGCTVKTVRAVADLWI